MILDHQLFVTLGVQLAQTNHDIFRFHRSVFYSHFKSKVGNILTKSVTLCHSINLTHKMERGKVVWKWRGWTVSSCSAYSFTEKHTVTKYY